VAFPPGRQEILLFQDFSFNREFTLHLGVPLFEAIQGLDVGLDIHFTVADLGVVDIVGLREDIDLVE
jgi:hypothetical protein